MSTLVKTPGASDQGAPSPAWWRLPIVWLVIGGPAIVVIASFVTLTLAILNPDPVLNTPRAQNAADEPAIQGRNHAASPR